MLDHLGADRKAFLFFAEDVVVFDQLLLSCLNGKVRKKTVWVISELADSESLKQLSFSRQRKILSVISEQKEKTENSKILPTNNNNINMNPTHNNNSNNALSSNNSDITKKGEYIIQKKKKRFSFFCCFPIN